MTQFDQSYSIVMIFSKIRFTILQMQGPQNNISIFDLIDNAWPNFDKKIVWSCKNLHLKWSTKVKKIVQRILFFKGNIFIYLQQPNIHGRLQGRRILEAVVQSWPRPCVRGEAEVVDFCDGLCKVNEKMEAFFDLIYWLFLYYELPVSSSGF